VNKNDVKGGNFFQVYCMEEAIDRLLEEHDDLIESVSPLPDSLKIKAELRAKVRPHRERTGDEVFEVDIEVFLADGVKSAEIAAEDISSETQLDFEVVTYEFLVSHVELTLGEMENVASIVSKDPRVSLVTIRPQMQLWNHFGSMVLQDGGPTTGNQPNFPFHDAGINGETQVVGVADSGLDYGSCFFQDQGRQISTLAQGTEFEDLSQRKILQYIAFADGTEGETTGHGTHVTGSVLGKIDNSGACATSCGALNGGAATADKYQGNAYEAKVAFFDIGLPNARFLNVPNNMFTMTEPAYRVGARIHTNSWGSSSNSYTSSSYYFDLYSFENQDFLVTIAAGNDGSASTASDGTLGSPATGKNVLSVGAGEQTEEFWQDLGINCDDCDDNDIASFSSRGPAYDGRVNPQVIAPGHLIGSASSTPTSATSCDLALNAGTSMATPLIAGSAALVREFFEKGFYPSGSRQGGDGFKPMGSLVKAVLIHSAQDISDGSYCATGQDCTENNGGTIAPKPSSTQGYGRSVLTEALTLGSSGRTFVEGKCPSSGTCTKTATNNWEGMPYVEQGTTKEWQIQVKSDATFFKATIAWSDPTSSNLIGTTAALTNDIDLVVIDANGGQHRPILSSGNDGVDSVNTVEHVSVTGSIPSGTWTVRVTGTDISSTEHSRQPFAVVVTSSFELDEVTNNGGCGGACAKAGDIETTGMALSIVAVILLLGGVVATVYFLTLPKLSMFVWGLLRIVVFISALVETILLSDLAGEHWRTDGALAFAVIIFVVEMTLGTIQILGSCRQFGMEAIAGASWFQMLAGGLSCVFFFFLLIFAPALASSVRADSGMIIVGFVLLIFYAFFVVMFLVAGGASKLTGQSPKSTRKRGPPPATKPKPRPKPKRKPKTPPKKKKLAKGAKARAKWSYAAAQSDELSLSKGDTIKILSVQGDGWCEGMNMSTYKKGMFPGNYVRVI